MSTIGGIGLETIARDAIRLHDKAFAAKKLDFLPSVGQFHYRKDGIKHAWNPETIATLQLATRKGDYELFKNIHISLTISRSLSSSVISSVSARILSLSPR